MMFLLCLDSLLVINFGVFFILVAVFVLKFRVGLFYSEVNDKLLIVQFVFYCQAHRLMEKNFNFLKRKQFEPEVEAVYNNNQNLHTLLFN